MNRIIDTRPSTIRALENHARNIRVAIIEMIARAGAGHPAGALGLADIFTALYFQILRFNSKNPHDKNRDYLLLSNGHVAPVLYATLAEKNLIAKNELANLAQLGTKLQGHPERTACEWIETTSGPLGEGISQGAGIAWTLKNIREKTDQFVYVITGDGELDEGENWEALMFAAKNRLNNLVVIVDRNNIQIQGKTDDVMPLEQLAEKFRSFGWNAREIDGHNFASIIEATAAARADNSRPTAIIAHTISGRGVDFMEGDYRWHGKVPNPDETARALAQLKNGGENERNF